MDEKENDEDNYGIINFDEFNTLIFDRTDEPENSSINNEPSFDLDDTYILKDNDNNNNHYRCPKCLFFPYIEIIDKNEIKYICKCTKGERKKVKIKELINEITNFKDEKNNNKELKCSKHNQEFRYYCTNCNINICKECCEFHLNKKHDFIIFDFNNYDIRNKIKKLIKYFNSKKNDNNQIKEKIPDNNNNLNISELIENSSNFQEEFISDELKNEIKSYKMKFEENNSNVIIEENDPYYFYKLFNIIYKDYIKYPNYSHFFNIENIFRFMEKEMTTKKIMRLKII